MLSLALRATRSIHKKLSRGAVCRLVVPVIAIFWMAGAAEAADLRVLLTGLGSGSVTSNITGISCPTDCTETYGAFQTVTLTATPATGSTFAGWDGDCTGTATCVLSMATERAVRAKFQLSSPIPTLTSFTPAGIQSFLTANPSVNSAARLVAALPVEFKRNWVLMSRSESLQTGTAKYPRILLPKADATAVFTIGPSTDLSYPGAHPDAVEYMQWDPAEKNFRFHEIVLTSIPAMGTVPARTRGIKADDLKCSKCHSTRNIENSSPFPGTSGIPAGLVKVKNKPNWDTYDSWTGMLPLNRDRIYQGTVEAAAFRRILNPWTWSSEPAVRAVIEQLELQPPGIPPGDAITRIVGGANDGHVNFAFDASPPVLIEPPPPTGTSGAIFTNYAFDGMAGTGTASVVERDNAFITLRHTNVPTSIDEGRGVRLFDALGGLAGTLNQQRVADEVASHRFATGSVPIDVRPVALAITKNCLTINTTLDQVDSFSGPALTVPKAFFDARNGMTINGVFTDTETRSEDTVLRKADLQLFNLNRSSDFYLDSAATTNGLIQEYGAFTDPSQGTSTALDRIRQEVFRRALGGFPGDSTVMGGIYVDRELYSANTAKVAMYRYFLEPLGVSVDKWSMGVRGRSRTYSFADIFNTYTTQLRLALEADLTADPITGLSSPYSCNDLVTATNNTLSSANLPAAADVPTFTDVQRIFNKSCIECHGGLDYPPYSNYGTSLDLSEDESPPTGDTRFTRSYTKAVARAGSLSGPLYSKITNTSENCPFGMMPCDGPPLSKTDIETIRRWIVGSTPSTVGDPHLRTVDNVFYDFQAAGEFVLLRDVGFELQTRQTAVETAGPLGPDAHTGLTSCVSVNTAVATRLGTHRVTYQPGLSGGFPDPAGMELRIDGNLVPFGSWTTQNLSGGGRVRLLGNDGSLQMESPGGTVVVVHPRWWHHHQIWFLQISLRQARGHQGMIGSIAPGGWLPALPDGTDVGPRPVPLNDRYDVLYHQVGDAWRVTNSTSLFDYGSGTSTATFTLPEWPLGESPPSCKIPEPVLGSPVTEAPAPIAMADAQQICQQLVLDINRIHCAQDLAITGAEEFVEAYAWIEKIMLNEPPAIPVLLFPLEVENQLQELPVELAWQLGQEEPQEGEELTHRLCVWNEQEDLTFNHCIEVWDTVALWPDMFEDAQYPETDETELGKAYFWKVITEDELGAVAESETRRFEIH